MFIKKAYAQLVASDFGVSDSLGVVDSLRASLIWVFNLLKWLGWAGVVAGVGFAIFMGIYAMAFGDSEEVVTNLKSSIVKAVLIVLLGILLLSAGFILKVVGGLVDVNILFDIPERL
jgi:hypothetical protein